MVKKGSPLLSISSGVSRADGGSFAAHRAAILLSDEQAMLAQAGVRAGRADAEESSHLKQVELSRSQIADLTSQEVLQKEIIRASVSELERIADVAQRGYIPRSEMDAKRKNLAIERQRLSELSAQLAQKKSDLEIQLLSARTSGPVARQEHVENLARERNALRLKLADLAEQDAYTITAPVDGRVGSLQVAPDLDVKPAAALMAISPVDQAQFVQLRATAKVVSRLQVGQKLDIFIGDESRAWPGEITDVASSSLQPGELVDPNGESEAVYLVRARLVGNPVHGPVQTRFRSGVSVQARVAPKSMTIFSWLLSRFLGRRE
ncbi:HlyD family secretion protein [Sphingomonas psychrotolerans]|uniref:HlyD family secretion protein n=1 Tax=Sphingomonas psychrotolerans TaxID=1327635 RepID=A0ABU3N4D7_9SPHN|nr:HlyD family efflux transporter periplasmic adaptor subunit [Sphingomonas psychrotolerans]MDT8759337.1 HlyD family secretion protein [Sphingomonas psychrotolerans]